MTRTLAPPLAKSDFGSKDNGNRTSRSFSDLPYELRSRIWRMHLERPRIVIIRGIVDGSGVEVSGNELGNVACNAHWYCENRSPALFRSPTPTAILI
ncbi:hypothetical protein CH063_11007 [Colletotrichum higginsianum]|uniref:2EXR domain-containing protein n=1 Tax=Colletotrichum higginsianum (strain IMI 349063) TaxID=759273 RepID=H1VJN8_COLHI|nr:hypothetical protein CH063_11007 [Colletotrichum higginsianum]